MVSGAGLAAAQPGIAADASAVWKRGASVQPPLVASLQGCYVETPYGWGICSADDGPDESHVKVSLDWRLGGPQGQRVACSVRRQDIRDRSFCAAGDCVLTSFGAGVLIGFRQEDGTHIVQLWGPLSHGRNRAFLKRTALLALLPAAPGLAVETAFGPGTCRGFRFGAEACSRNRGALEGAEEVAGQAQQLQRVGGCYRNGFTPEAYLVDWPWGSGVLEPGSLRCPAAMMLPLINRFLDHAADLLRLHLGTLARLADALGGTGLERLQEKLSSHAGEAMEAATQFWEDTQLFIAEKETEDVVGSVVERLKKQADEAMANPKLKTILDAGVARLDKLVCRAQGFDGLWLGKGDGQPRAKVTDAVLLWHWGEESDLEIWGPDRVCTVLQDELFKATLLPDGNLRWDDGDIWVLQGGRPLVTSAEEEEEHLGVEEVVGELAGASSADLAKLRQSLAALRRVVALGTDVAAEDEQRNAMKGAEEETYGGDFDSNLHEALGALTRAARVATGDADVKRLLSAFEDQVQQRQEQLLEVQEQLLQSKAGRVLLQGQARLTERLLKLQETEITPQLEGMHNRSKRFLTRLATDKKVKNKASEIFSVLQSRLTDRWSAGGTSGGSQGLESWVSSVREAAMSQLGAHRAALVGGLSGLQLQLKEADLRQLVSGSSWDQTAALEAQLERSLLRALAMTGIRRCSGSELLDRFESAKSLSHIPVVQETSSNVLSVIADLGLEVPSGVRQLLEAQAAGRGQDAAAWHAALVDSLDDDAVVQGASGLVEHGETVLSHIQELKSSQAVARVMEHLENEDIERELLKRIHDFDPQKVLSTAEEALTSVEAREALISHLKDHCLDFILKILPAIHIEKVEGNDNGCAWEINDINFSDFAFRKENVHIALGNPACPQEELLRVSAWDISAHFRKLKVTVNQEFFPFLTADCIADAKAERMSVGFAFKLKPGVNGKQPELVMSSRSVHMDHLELWVGETNYAVVVNALSFLFADVLKSYACQKIADQLDEQMEVLVASLNSALVTCAPLLNRLGLDLLPPDKLGLRASSGAATAVPGSASVGAAGTLLGFEEAPESRRSVTDLAAEDPEPCTMRSRAVVKGRATVP
ncbi:unnamed protein product, partial [Polarella glacialis]